MAKKRLLIAQLGTPVSPKVRDVRSFLSRFLSDPRVVGLPRLWWQLFLRCILLPFYAPKSAKLYARLWDGEMFLSKRKTLELEQSLKNHLDDTFEIEIFFSYSSKIVGHKSEQDVFILFPQYCESTHGVIRQQVLNYFPQSKILPSFHDQEFYISACAQHIDEALGAVRAQGQWIQKVILSFHNMPLKQIKKWDDPYLTQCQETYKLIKSRLREIEKRDVHIAFQSRFGRGRWAKPETRNMVLELLKKGDTHIAVFCPGFLVDGVETVDEIGHRLCQEVKSLGGELLFIPCLINREDFVQGLSRYLLK